MKIIARIIKFRPFRRADREAARAEALCDGSEFAPPKVAGLGRRPQDAAPEPTLFGLSADRAIPAAGDDAALLYLSTLTTPGVEFSFAHRVGEDGRLSIFEVVSADGQTRTRLYVDTSAKRTAAGAPDGFIRTAETGSAAFLTAVSTRLERFPDDLPAALRAESMRRFGRDMTPPRLPELLARNRAAIAA